MTPPTPPGIAKSPRSKHFSVPLFSISREGRSVSRIGLCRDYKFWGWHGAILPTWPVSRASSTFCTDVFAWNDEQATQTEYTRKTVKLLHEKNASMWAISRPLEGWAGSNEPLFRGLSARVTFMVGDGDPINLCLIQRPPNSAGSHRTVRHQKLSGRLHWLGSSFF